jgi:hypothetical protein
MFHAWDTKMQWFNLETERAGDRLEDLEVQQSITFTRMEWDGNWIRLLRIRNTGGLLRTWQLMHRIHMVVTMSITVCCDLTSRSLAEIHYISCLWISDLRAPYSTVSLLNSSVASFPRRVGRLVKINTQGDQNVSVHLTIPFISIRSSSPPSSYPQQL